MKIVNHKIKVLLFFIALLTFEAHAQLASNLDGFYPVIGPIAEIRESGIVVNDLYFVALPTVNVILASKNRGKFSDLKLGDTVGLSFVIINHKKRIDKITILKSK